MKTQKASGSASRPRIPLEKRVVVGTIFGAVGSDYCNLNLPDGRRGRLHKERADRTLQDCWDQLRADDRMFVFLLNPTERDPRFWSLNQRWADKDINPWFRRCPQVGEDVSGRVVRYVEDYAAIVVLDHTEIEALLHRAQVPGVGYDPIAETLYVGDRVCGRITRVNTGLLQVDLDLQPVIEKQRTQARTEAQAQKRVVRESGETRPSPRAFHAEPVLEGVRLWVVDNNQGFRSALAAWLDLLGAEVEPLHSCKVFDDRLHTGDRPTHLLLDCLLDGGSDEWSECDRLIASMLGEETQVAVCSGDEALLRASHYPSFLKPLNAKELLVWLSQGKPPAPHQESPESDRENPWVTRALELDFQQEATDLLAEFCRDLGLAAALWAERTRPGFFEPLAWHGLDTRQVHETQPFFGQTLIAGVIERETEEEQDKFGPLEILVPDGCASVFGLPLRKFGAPDHALILFSRRQLPEGTKQTLRILGRGLAALVVRREMTRALDEERPFAVLGRFWSGYAHELKQIVAPALLAIRGFRGRLASQANTTDQGAMVRVQEIRGQTRTLLDQLEQLERTAGYELGRIRRRGAQRVRVIETVRRVVDLVEADLRQQSQRQTHKDPHHQAPGLWLDQAPATELEIALDAQALEQSLFNLLSNALYQVGPLGDAGVVKVRIQVHPEDADGLPLWVQVEDNGPGIDAGQRIRLFRPRTSTRGPEGIGMGLYISERLVHGVGGATGARRDHTLSGDPISDAISHRNIGLGGNPWLKKPYLSSMTTKCSERCLRIS
ncbi:MAG: S1 RNA-binding domain-containing protein [Candidatus Thiosymbion ectosymbiont of Robbea hypermnestra]|nr:S1 RNA-binding domain-containing protein [Candidatus Thiosymbion ectosymbiont of Robbea hypermnestra]